MIRLPDKSAPSVMKAFEQLRNEYNERFSLIFKTITTDNGSEFSLLSYSFLRFAQFVLAIKKKLLDGG